jgi:hypothetical protein
VYTSWIDVIVRFSATDTPICVRGDSACDNDKFTPPESERARSATGPVVLRLSETGCENVALLEIASVVRADLAYDKDM